MLDRSMTRSVTALLTRTIFTNDLAYLIIEILKKRQIIYMMGSNEVPQDKARSGAAR